jgi:ribosomal protein L7/L12
MKLRLTEAELLDYFKDTFCDRVTAVEIISPTVTHEGKSLLAIIDIYRQETARVNNKIPAIKDVRSLCGCGLKEAKNFVELRYDIQKVLIERFGLSAPNKINE